MTSERGHRLEAELAELRPRRVEGVWHRFVAEPYKDRAPNLSGCRVKAASARSSGRPSGKGPCIAPHPGGCFQGRLGAAARSQLELRGAGSSNKEEWSGEGLIREGESVAARVLEAVGVAIHRTRVQVVYLLGEESRAPADAELADEIEKLTQAVVIKTVGEALERLLANTPGLTSLWEALKSRLVN